MGTTNNGSYIIPLFGVVPTNIHSIPASDDPDTLTADTIAMMRSNVFATVKSPIVQQATTQALKGLGTNPSDKQKANAIHTWIRRNVQFVPDASILQRIGIADEDEALIAPDRLLTMSKPQGDCDDFSQLAAAMLTNAGVANHFVTIAGERDDPQRFSHVYNMVETEEGLTPFDSSHGKRFGVEAPVYFRKKVWEVMPLNRSLDNQVLRGREDRLRLPFRQPRDVGVEQVVNARRGFKGMGDVTELNTPWSEVWNPSIDIFGGGDTVPFSSGGGSGWTSVLQNVIGQFTGAAATRLAYPAGTFLQQTPGGTTLIRTSPNADLTAYQGMNFGTGGMGTLLLLGGGLLLVVALMGRQ